MLKSGLFLVKMWCSGMENRFHLADPVSFFFPERQRYDIPLMSSEQTERNKNHAAITNINHLHVSPEYHKHWHVQINPPEQTDEMRAKNRQLLENNEKVFAGKAELLPRLTGRHTLVWRWAHGYGFNVLCPTPVFPQKDKLAEKISVNLCFLLRHDINEGIYETLTEI